MKYKTIPTDLLFHLELVPRMEVLQLIDKLKCYIENDSVFLGQNWGKILIYIHKQKTSKMIIATLKANILIVSRDICRNWETKHSKCLKLKELCHKYRHIRYFKSCNKKYLCGFRYTMSIVHIEFDLHSRNRDLQIL